MRVSFFRPLPRRIKGVLQAGEDPYQPRLEELPLSPEACLFNSSSQFLVGAPHSLTLFFPELRDRISHASWFLFVSLARLLFSFLGNQPSVFFVKVTFSFFVKRNAFFPPISL